MREFKDIDGQAWHIRITVATLQRVKEETGVLLTDLVSSDNRDTLLKKLQGDVFFLFGLIVSVLQPQLATRTMDAKAFGEKLDEEAAENAVDALINGVIDFFPPDRRDPLLAMMAKVSQAFGQKRAAAKQDVLARIETPEFLEAIDKHLEQAIADASRRPDPDSTSGPGSGSSPDSSASTPDPAPSAS
jgi:hypothetical protein